MNQPQQKIKSFFERPEGNTGLLFMALGIIAFFVLGYYFLPAIIVVLTNTLYAIGLGVALFCVVGLLLNDKFRFLCWSMFKSVMRWITGWFIAVDPIGILKNYIEDMKDRIRQFEENVAKLTGQISIMRRNIEDKKRNIERYMRLAKAAQDKGQGEMVQLQTRKAGREKNFIEKLIIILRKMETLKEILSKMKKNIEFLREDTEHEVEVKEAEYNSTRAAYKAMKGAQALIMGDKAKELFEQTMEYIAQDVGEKLGEMDRFMEVSEDFMNNMDLENAVFNEEGLEMLMKWEEGSLMLDYDKKRSEKVRVEDPNSQAEKHHVRAEIADYNSNLIQTPLEENKTSKNSFANVFNK